MTHQHSAGSGLDELIRDAEAAARCDVSDFIRSGLRAARHSRAHARASILRDVARVLGVEPTELDFMFSAPCLAANDRDPMSLPDFRARLRVSGERLVAAE